MSKYKYRLSELESEIIRLHGEVVSYINRRLCIRSLGDPFDDSDTIFGSKWYLVKDPDFEVGMHVN